MYNQGSQPPVTLISIALRNLKPGLENIIKEQEQQRGGGGGHTDDTSGDMIFRQGFGKGNWKGEEGARIDGF